MGLSYRDPYKEKEDGELKNTTSDLTNTDNSTVVGDIKGNADDGDEQQQQKQDQQKQDQEPLKQQQLQTDSHTSAFISIAR